MYAYLPSFFDHDYGDVSRCLKMSQETLAAHDSTVPRRRLQALQLGGPAALVGALAATLAAAVNGQLMEVAGGPRTGAKPSVFFSGKVAANN